MSATSPRPSRWSGPIRRRTQTPNHEPTLGEVVGKLQSASRSDGPTVLARLLDSAGIEARFAIIKLVTGGLRIGVSARLAKQALADFGKVDVAEIEELWHGLTPPYTELFAWLEGKAPQAREGRQGAVPAGHAVATRSRTATSTGSIPTTMPPNGNGTASACRRSRRAASAGSIRAPATTCPAPFPTSSRR